MVLNVLYQEVSGGMTNRPRVRGVEQAQLSGAWPVRRNDMGDVG